MKYRSLLGSRGGGHDDGFVAHDSFAHSHRIWHATVAAAADCQTIQEVAYDPAKRSSPLLRGEAGRLAPLGRQPQCVRPLPQRCLDLLPQSVLGGQAEPAVTGGRSLWGAARRFRRRGPCRQLQRDGARPSQF